MLKKLDGCFTKYYNYIDESYFEVQKHCKGCVDNTPDQQVREYGLETDEKKQNK